MIPRYQSAAMKLLWSEEEKFQTWFKVELAFLMAYLKERGEENPELINKLLSWQRKTDWAALAKKVSIHEQKSKHDVIAFLAALEEELLDDARLIHLGLTSSDIVDTSFALLLKQSCIEIEEKLKALINTLWHKANEMRGVLCLGRTHGQAAEPMTFGIKLLSHLMALLRGHKALKEAQDIISVGKFSGAIGTYSYADSALEESALKTLGLRREDVATQVVARDRHANFFCTLAIIGGSLERLALELRLLAHGEIKEAYEPFLDGQKGSSAMPHKKNPILLENVCGLMRLLRSYAMAALEDQALWHERDISHSSVERVIAPDATSLIDFAISRLTFVIEGLVVEKERMAHHVKEAGESIFAQGVMLALIEKGMGRKSAYELVQKAAHQSEQGFREALSKLGIAEWLNEKELSAVFDKKFSSTSEELLFTRVQREIRALEG